MRWQRSRVGTLFKIAVAAKPSRTTLKQRLELIGTLATAVAAFFAAGKYVLGWFSPIELEIELPQVVELRCSNYLHNVDECTKGSRPDESHMTVTAAIYLRATGDSSKEATITYATATVTQRSNPSRPYKLTWLWSADFVPGQQFQRKQVTVSSIKGGETRSQEMWFFPLEEPCGATMLALCDTKSRVNFVPWLNFYTALALTDPKSAVDRNALDVAFEFHYRQGTEAKVRSVSCMIEISPTVQRMATPREDRGVLAITAPCRLTPSTTAS